MRRPAKWTHQLDERVLERLADDGWPSRGTTSRHFRFTASADRIEERREELRDAGLLAPIYRGAPMCELTTLGYLYLAGNSTRRALHDGGRWGEVRPGWWAGFG